MLRGTRRGKSRVTPSRRSGTGTRREAASQRTSPRSASSGPGTPAKLRSAARISPQPKKHQVVNARLRPGADYETALKNFEIALGYFRKCSYEKASAFFEKVLASAVREVAERARMHLRICEQKTRQQAPPKTAEELYLRGIAALNSRELEYAIQYLSKSDKMVPNQEHVHYALAAAYGLQGDSDTSLTYLQKAIELQPKNRVQARLDDDFKVLAGDPRFERLVGIRTS